MRLALVMAALLTALPRLVHAQDDPVDLRSVEEAMELARQHMREEALRRTARPRAAPAPRRATRAHAAPPPAGAPSRPDPFENEDAMRAAAIARAQLEDARAGR